ncbi:MAG: hypothetical protein Q8N58_02320 [bacterium]|nr:hypothetical protein [bacterium]
MPQISESTQKLISYYQNWHQSLQPEEGITKIHVDEVASRVAAFYEKIRGIIDWKEEHLLKRGAIERILKRRLLTEEKSNIAEFLVLELIRGGHFPNDKIEEEKISQVQKTIDKYVFILNNAPKGENKSKMRLYNWLLEIAACEIEEVLSPSLKERAIMNYMFELMKDKIQVSERILKIRKITDKEKNTQIYVAVQRALFKLDAPVISYHLLKYRYLEWKYISEEKIQEISRDIYSIKEKLDRDLNYPLADKFYQICEQYDTPYLLLGDVLSQNRANLKEIADPEKLEKLVTEAYKKRLKTLRKRLGKIALYSTLSIFITKIISLFLVETFLNKMITGQFFNLWTMGINILFPTFLMFLLVITIRSPGPENLPRIIMEVMKIVYNKGKEDVYEIKTFRKKNIVFSTIINLFYLSGFLIVLALIVWGLGKLNFPPISKAVFIVFLALIAFAGTKTRQRAKELQVIEEKETIFYFLIDPFAVPIIQLGKWLTNKWKKYNIIAIFFSALIDMPFIIFIEFIEQWRYFLKEKKEKIH